MSLLARLPAAVADIPTSPNAFLVFMMLGFAIGVAGHLFGSKTMVAAGILMVFGMTVALPFVLGFSR